MQVILSPMEAIADTYRALLPEGSGADFLRILDLKVIIDAILLLPNVSRLFLKSTLVVYDKLHCICCILSAVLSDEFGFRGIVYVLKTSEGTFAL